MAIIHNMLGISTFPQELQTLSLKYFCLRIIVSGIYLSHTWISLYYISILDSFGIFGIIVAIGMLFGACLDLPLGLLTDRLGQRIAFSGAMSCLVIYYMGLLFASTAIQLLILEIVVGIYSALISGSFISWFMNSWESLTTQETGNSMLIRNVMGSISFANTIIIAFAIFLGGVLLQEISNPKIIFISQAFIALIGIYLGFKFISPSRVKKGNNFDIIEKKEILDIYKEKSTFRQNLKAIKVIIKEKYLIVFPFFICFSLLNFTSTSFSSLIFSPLLYEISTKSQSFVTNDIVVHFASISLLLITLTKASSDIIFAFFCRISGKVTSFIQSPYKGILIFYILDYPIVWLLYTILLFLALPLYLTLILFILILFFKIILSGLSTGLYWQLYFKITSSNVRSSQESLFNTINLLISLIGFWFIGITLEYFKFIGALIFLFILSSIGLGMFLCSKNPDSLSEKS